MCTSVLVCICVCLSSKKKNHMEINKNMGKKHGYPFHRREKTND